MKTTLLTFITAVVSVVGASGDVTDYKEIREIHSKTHRGRSLSLKENILGPSPTDILQNGPWKKQAGRSYYIETEEDGHDDHKHDDHTEDDQHMNDDGMGDDGMGDDMFESECQYLDAMYYNETAITPAALEWFIFGGMWRDPNFDLDGYFEALDFTNQCSALGGEVYEVDIKFSCPDTILVEGFKLCRPPMCSDFEYLFTKSFVVSILGEFLQCDGIELISDVNIPSVECLSGVGEIYEDELAFALPETFLFDGGIQYIEYNTTACKTYSNMMDLKVCDFDTLTDSPEGQLITSSCDAAGADLFMLDMMLDYPFYHRTMKRYPFCKPTACSEEDIITLYEYVASFFTGEQYYDGQVIKSSLKIDAATYNSCDETVTDKAFMKKWQDNVAVKNCKWLKRRSADKKEKICKKTNGYDGYEPAGVVCPSTCCTCSESPEDTFLKKSSIGDDFLLEIESKDCAWLQQASENAKNYQCSKKAASYVGGLPPAYVACPQTCGGCSE